MKDAGRGAPERRSAGGGGGEGNRKPPCPICGKPAEAAFRPFCSRRCADVDLGRWLGERYVIPGPEADPDASDPA